MECGDNPKGLNEKNDIKSNTSYVMRTMVCIWYSENKVKGGGGYFLELVK